MVLPTTPGCSVCVNHLVVEDMTGRGGNWRVWYTSLACPELSVVNSVSLMRKGTTVRQSQNKPKGEMRGLSLGTTGFSIAHGAVSAAQLIYFYPPSVIIIGATNPCFASSAFWGQSNCFDHCPKCVIQALRIARHTFTDVGLSLALTTICGWTPFLF